MDKLGQYITQEYGLLKQILRYLTAKDLITARKVCREWAKVVEVILAEENKLVWGYTLEPGEDWTPGKFVQTIPKVIFYYTNRSVSGCRDLESCPCKHGDDSTELIMMRDGVLNYQQKSLFESGAYDFMLHSSCMLLLPSMPGVEVNSLSISRKDKIIDQKVTDDTLNQLIGNEPIKCLLIYTYTSSTKTKRWINSFLKKVVDRQGSNTVAIGGGDANKLILFKGKEHCRMEKPLIYMITFKGDNVTAHSQLLKATTKPGIDEFMDRMSKDVGPMPSGAQRFAFVVKCVNRCFFWDNTPEDMTYEGEKFKEAFPGVPHYGFFGFGEYGINTLASDCSEIKRRKFMQVLCTNTTSFVILTLHNVPQSRKICNCS